MSALHDIALDPGSPLYFPLPSGSRARYAELTVYSDTGAALPSIGIFQNPAGVCERHTPDSSPCRVG